MVKEKVLITNVYISYQIYLTCLLSYNYTHCNYLLFFNRGLNVTQSRKVEEIDLAPLKKKQSGPVK